MKTAVIRFTLVIMLAGHVNAETASPLPAPDGPQRVGTTAWHMIDARRDDPMTAAEWDRRELMVQAWYPTDDDSTGRAPYALAQAGMGDVTTHAIPGASVQAHQGGLPVVLIAPGRGTPGFYYTAVAESLASHGFVAVAIDSPHSGRVYYPDGRSVPPSPRFQPDRALFRGPYSEVDKFFEPAAEAGRKDLLFVMSELTRLNADDPAGRFTGMLDLERSGVFAHSLGGRIGGAAVASDQRFKAFMSMEGVAPRAPRRAGLDAAVAMLLSAGTYPYAIDNVAELVPGRRNDVFIIKLEGFGHNSVTDRPLLDSDADSEEAALYNLQVTRDLARAFFSRYLRDAEGAFDAPGRWPAIISIESYPYEQVAR